MNITRLLGIFGFSLSTLLLVLPATSTSAPIQNEVCNHDAWRLYGFESKGQCRSLVKSGDVKVWGLFRDFLFSPNQLNPSPDQYGNPDVWHYRYSTGPDHNPASYVLYTDYIIEWEGARESWTANPTSEYNTPLLGARPNEEVGVLHPDNFSLSIASWRSPIDGTVAINGYFHDIHTECGNGVDWSIERETPTGVIVIAQGSIKGPPADLSDKFNFNFTIPVQVGDFIDFIIDPAENDFGCDTTWSNITIVGPIPAN